jgi:hypothetical protein
MFPNFDAFIAQQDKGRAPDWHLRWWCDAQLWVRCDWELTAMSTAGLKPKATVTIQLSGGLGNQLFQYAAARSLAIDRDAELLLDISFFDRRRHREFELSQFSVAARCVGSVSRFRWVRSLQKFLQHAVGTSPARYVEMEYRYSPSLTSLALPAVLVGYFQSYKYFEKHADVLAAELVPPEPRDSESRDLLKILQAEDSVSVHVRRGDYITNAKAKAIFCECSAEYYRAALKKLPRNAPVVVFSDDIEWAKNNLRLGENACFAGERGSRSGLADFSLMTRACHHVIANSTFSWWGAWLSGGKGLTVSPEKWFTSSDSRSIDLIPPHWLKI